MESLAKGVLDPRSPTYGKVYSPEEIKEISGPADLDYQQLLQNLAQQGFKVVGESRTHLFVTVKGSKQSLEQAFTTQLRYVDLAQTQYFALNEPLVPSSLGLVESVNGLDNTNKRHPHIIATPLKTTASAPKYNSTYIRTKYGFDPIYKAGITGHGQHIAIAGYNGSNLSHIKAYFTQSNIKPAPKVDQVEFNGKPQLDSGSAMETEMDAEFSGMIAPGAQIHIFGSAHNDDAGEVQLFTAILDDNRAKVVNYSWGSCEPQVTPEHRADMDKIFARAVAQGVNIMVASGDDGSAGCTGSSETNADYPASHPYVVAVGGTTIHESNGQLSETAWKGSGGGISTLFDSPDWQSDFRAPYVRRSFPDVAFNADPATGEPAWLKSGFTTGWVSIGGTSIAAPQWSGFMTLVNEARGTRGALGLLNPHVYSLTSDQQASFFRDITKGSNGAYASEAGWDAVTGWGSMKAADLLEYLRTL